MRFCRLLVEDRVLGGINFGFDHPRRFDPAERAFITALAQQCAQALERARLTDVAASRLSEIEQLNARLKQALAETHHRVKNNLQVISALVELQTDVAEAMVPAEALRRVGGHARALATLHDLLTDQAKSSYDMSTVSTRALFGKMLPLLQSTMGERALHSEIEEVRFRFVSARPCACSPTNWSAMPSSMAGRTSFFHSNRNRIGATTSKKSADKMDANAAKTPRANLLPPFCI